ncbi:acetyltransferase (GNAT) family protein [Microbacterium sp. AG790]|uniref:GNAT family N-acetyltransferase n=1 Tax=Microbacterium sp. AG790 TaxID=2183995 RepID=UPI000EACB1F8|nr:GNAT family N-acetyltransferase [Microbacterium sp. AG790]RKS92924.1 acetyltransferase (GNAT) family protein [Microbacterium sp. AG790]
MTRKEPLDVRELAASEVDRIEADEPPGKGFVREMWRLQAAGQSVLLVAWDGDVPVGSAQLDLRTAPVELKNLNVRADSRGRGVGTALIAAAKAWMRARGHAQLSIGAGVDNPAARRLYERVGFVGTGEVSTITYDYVDAEGISRTATETDERLIAEVS